MFLVMVMGLAVIISEFFALNDVGFAVVLESMFSLNNIFFQRGFHDKKSIQKQQNKRS